MHHFLEMEAQYENLEKLYRDMLYRDALVGYN